MWPRSPSNQLLLRSRGLHLRMRHGVQRGVWSRHHYYCWRVHIALGNQHSRTFQILKQVYGPLSETISLAEHTGAWEILWHESSFSFLTHLKCCQEQERLLEPLALKHREQKYDFIVWHFIKFINMMIAEQICFSRWLLDYKILGECIKVEISSSLFFACRVNAAVVGATFVPHQNSSVAHVCFLILRFYRMVIVHHI